MTKPLAYTAAALVVAGVASAGLYYSARARHGSDSAGSKGQDPAFNASDVADLCPALLTRPPTDGLNDPAVVCDCEQRYHLRIVREAHEVLSRADAFANSMNVAARRVPGSAVDQDLSTAFGRWQQMHAVVEAMERPNQADRQCREWQDNVARLREKPSQVPKTQERTAAAPPAGRRPPPPRMMIPAQPRPAPPLVAGPPPSKLEYTQQPDGTIAATVHVLHPSSDPSYYPKARAYAQVQKDVVDLAMLEEGLARLRVAVVREDQDYKSPAAIAQKRKGDEFEARVLRTLGDLQDRINKTPYFSEARTLLENESHRVANDAYSERIGICRGDAQVFLASLESIAAQLRQIDADFRQARAARVTELKSALDRWVRLANRDGFPADDGQFETFDFALLSVESIGAAGPPLPDAAPVRTTMLSGQPTSKYAFQVPTSFFLRQGPGGSCPGEIATETLAAAEQMKARVGEIVWAGHLGGLAALSVVVATAPGDTPPRQLAASEHVAQGGRRRLEGP